MSRPIFISFDNIDKFYKPPFNVEKYTTTLEEQFEDYKDLTGLARYDDFRTFMNSVFQPGIEHKFRISYPNFNRENINESKYLNNVIIRIDDSQTSSSRLPKGQTLILVCDLKLAVKLPWPYLSVKGFELIDEEMKYETDMILYGTASVRFNYSSYTIPPAFEPIAMEHNPSEIPAITNEVVTSIITDCYPVNNKNDVKKFLKDRDEFINFKENYVEEQKKKIISISSAKLLEQSFSINKKVFAANRIEYEKYLLDGRKEFSEGNLIVINKEVPDSTPFPLVKVVIDYNNSDFESHVTVHHGKNHYKYEDDLRILVRDNCYLSNTNKISNNDKNMSETICSIDERFKLFSTVILPDVQIENCKKDFVRRLDEFRKIVIDRYKKEADEKAPGEEYSKLLYDLENENSLKVDKYERELKIKYNDKNSKEYKKFLKENKNHIYEDVSYKIYELVEDFRTKLSNNHYEKTEELTKKFKDEFMQSNELNIQNEVKAYQNTLANEQNNEIERLKKELTIRRFTVYFKIAELDESGYSKVSKKLKEVKYLRYDPRPESAKIKRQKFALRDFSTGYVKNPYLATYLFNPETLPTLSLEDDDWVWYLETLNEKQKEAVLKATLSNGVFLLQGPPGTGKTQVIAETVAHLVTRGKKVLISSETHKAIDNVFDRLPKIADIVPVRLISSGKKISEYSPEYLVNNFYNNIASNMRQLVKKYENFTNVKEEFDERYKELIYLNTSINESKNRKQKYDLKIQEYSKQIRELSTKKSDLRETNSDIKYKIDQIKHVIRKIENNAYDESFLKEDTSGNLTNYFEEASNLLNENKYSDLDLQTKLRAISLLKEDDVLNEIAKLDPSKSGKERDLEIDRLKKEFGEHYNDPEALKVISSKLNKLFKEKNESNELDINDFELSKIFSKQFLYNNHDEIASEFKSIKNQVLLLKERYKQICESIISEENVKIYNNKKEIEKYISKINELTIQINDIKETEDFSKISKIENDFKLKIQDFFKEFEIYRTYESNDEALIIIKEEREHLENDYALAEKENKKKIPIYKKISNYLTNDDVIENDKKLYTNKLFSSANVFGLTCTSSDRFTKERYEELQDYNISDFDIKNVGIDVVIIDEVSKSSFIDLLIPILYGKTVILVGDHRQLPPMYELGKMRKEEFEEINNPKLTYEDNIKNKKLYEECFFKTLFEKIKDGYKVMLDRQYRCHEQIMNVFNNFYDGELKLGDDGQNSKKEHFLDIDVNGVNIIEPSKHTYFINCRGLEAREEDSTSFINKEEAEVTTELVKLISEYQKEHKNNPRLSLGIISTYGDQAKAIRNMFKQEKIHPGIFTVKNEPLIISTVDDFQGDERDIIILSLVRNPEKGKKSDPGFINAYQRINVALSRARKLLIIVGNREYVTKKGIINLPDIYGRGKFYDQESVPIYEKIIDTIDNDGRILEAADIISQKEDN